METQIRAQSINKALPAPHSFGQRARGQGIEKGYGYQAAMRADQTPSPQIFSLPSASIAYKQFVQFNPMVWHTYREEVVGTQIRYPIDGVVVLKTQDAGWKDGGWVGLFAYGTQIAVRSFTVRALGSPSQGYVPSCGTNCSSGAVLYQANWPQGSKSLLDWSAPCGDPVGWDLQGGMLVTDGGSGGLVRPDFAPGDFGVNDYAVEAQIKLQGVAKIANPLYALRIRGQGLENGYGYDAALIAPARDAAQAAIYNAGQAWLGGKRFVVFDPTIWHTYRIEVSGKHLQYLIDGVPVAVTTNDGWKDGGFGGISFAGAKIAVQSASGSPRYGHPRGLQRHSGQSMEPLF